MITNLTITKRFIKIVAAWMIVTAAILGVAADCSGGDGMYQGGSDSEPGWR